MDKIPARAVGLRVNTNDNGEFTGFSVKMMRKDSGEPCYVRLNIGGKGEQWTVKKLKLIGFNNDVSNPQFETPDCTLFERLWTNDDGSQGKAYDIDLPMSGGGGRAPLSDEAKAEAQRRINALLGGPKPSATTPPPPPASAPAPSAPPPVAPPPAKKVYTRDIAWAEFSKNNRQQSVTTDWENAVSNTTLRTGRHETDFTSDDWAAVVSQACPI